jgi:hypothetical protein
MALVYNDTGGLAPKLFNPGPLTVVTEESPPPQATKTDKATAKSIHSEALPNRLK